MQEDRQLRASLGSAPRKGTVDLIEIDDLIDVGRVTLARTGYAGRTRESNLRLN